MKGWIIVHPRIEDESLQDGNPDPSIVVNLSAIQCFYPSTFGSSMWFCSPEEETELTESFEEIVRLIDEATK